ncbi:hypothetical protein DEU56DRAFT_915984 [Suillus clintonianus]|uniref:uncharacterized protein n=1 Tax=Suillus clintonianus TaxID=1904413 RepID=UPI001B874AE7|nr:uncharacterized protein DEU56DRAFT_915984 [Suillus clintonianus]KAG2126597.1 hypothetical protein DEU56DRAFT_915984 [Suillus clintonianus]
MSLAQPALASLQVSDYLSLTASVVVTYDFLLLLGREVELVWKRPWSLMSSLYVVVRYLGLALAIIDSFWGGVVNMTSETCYIIERWPLHYVYLGLWTLQLLNWGNFVFMIAMEGIMVLRIYAMYSQSKLILGVLLVLFLSVMALTLAIGIKYYGPHSGLILTQFSALNTNFCLDALGTDPMFFVYASIPSVLFDALLVVLATTRLVKHTIEMNQATGGWRINHSMKMIVRDSVLYFVLNLAYKVLNLIPLANIPVVCTSLAELFCAIEPYVLAPRLVINFREYNICTRGLMTSSDFMGPLLASNVVRTEYELSPMSPGPDSKFDIERDA